MLLLAGLYCASGWAGLQLAQPPGYATPIWPPSGIMLAMLLLWGVRVWPGVWLGSFAVNLWVGWAQASSLADVLPVAALIASGSTVEGLVGLALVRRFVSAPRTLDTGADVWRFFLFGGALANLIAATVGSLTLYRNGGLDASEVPFHWLTWWVGDCMGVFLFAPLVLAAASLRTVPWQRRFGPVAVAVAISISVGALVVQQTNRSESRRVSADFIEHAQVVDHHLETTLQEAVGAVRTLGDYFEASDDVSADDFSLFAGRLLQRAPGLSVVGWSPRIEAAARPGYESGIAVDGRAGIFEFDEAGQTRSASGRSDYFPIQYVYPQDGYAGVLGFDLGSEATRARTLRAAKASHRLAASPPLELVRGLGGGVLVAVPVDTAGQNGFVSGAIRFDQLMAHVLGQHPFEHIGVTLSDDGAPDGQAPMYGEALAAPALSWAGVHRIGGRTWRLTVTADDRYLFTHRSLQAWLTQVGVLLFSALLGSFLMVLTGKAARVHQLVAERTSELRERNLALSREIGERLATEQRLRLSAEVFEHIGEAIMITDAENHIITVNRAFTEITGYTEQEVRGQTPRVLSSGQHSASFYEELWASLRDTGAWRGEVWDRRKSGEIYPEWLNISIVRDGAGNTTHFVAVFSDISERKAAEERILYLAQVDALTNLPNRYLLGDRLQQTMESARRNGESFAVMFVDIDRFKNINDSLGHGVGDALLRAMSERLRVSVRASDTVARHGGDEFVIVIPGIVDAEQVAHIAGKILDAVSLPLRVDKHLLTTTASIGVAIYPSDGDDTESLMKHADAAMYAAKNSGRNAFRFFTQDMNSRVHEFLKTENELRSAIEHGQLTVYYQPQIDAVSGEVVGAEALVRWQHPERGLILPGHFIHVAEESGLIAAIDEWVLREACRQNRAWQDRGLKKIPVAVNLSAIELHRDDAIRKVERALATSGLDARWLELEVTESMLMSDVEHVSRLLHQLRAMGVQLALDDFGTGYSSLAYLRGFPLSALKVDSSFVRDLQADGNDAAICRAIIALGRTLGLRVVAEGVENAGQLAFLRRNQCDAVQGALFSWGVPADEMARFLLPSYVCPAIAAEVALL